MCGQMLIAYVAMYRLAAVLSMFCFRLDLFAVNARERPFHAVNYLKYYDVKNSVDHAKYLLSRNNLTADDLSKRLAVMLLYSSDVSDPLYGPCLKCSLQRYKDNLLPNNPSDIFLFVKPEHFQNIMERPWVRSTPNLYVMILAEESDKSWKIPEWIRPERDDTKYHWSAGFSLEYRLMGHWRLAFSFPFARELGYKYLMQSDTDTYILEKIQYNLIDFMTEKDIWVSNYNWIQYEVRGYNMGLPEIAHYWMATRGGMEGLYVTADNASTAGKGFIKGPLFKHCRPADIHGLHTCSEYVCHGEKWLGWDGEMFSGHYQIFKLDHWFSWEIQDFLQLVLQTGGHIEHRWVDISTQAMIRQMFTPDKNIHIFLDHNIGHGHGSETCNECKDWLS
ncbi:hypothetical protein CEUSTIGMA_g5278.t1 [Chlamydomonas eustigma]|uniref:Uncharacterized protein n=1 Tax=Chlamydomonas eustigma TaxID=1157962 RepID=A0A250X461_9CHLO|nr:hypothetical protein CEUSTIGMA_g5278.t1 [Chlamydomonas eustigma]|eukprot:GAX77836.1 hypothetical protein CEUSTIGMA_g5278.t1 [Chlamydomonas eustigma]